MYTYNIYTYTHITYKYLRASSDRHSLCRPVRGGSPTRAHGRAERPQLRTPGDGSRLEATARARLDRPSVRADGAARWVVTPSRRTRSQQRSTASRWAALGERWELGTLESLACYGSSGDDDDDDDDRGRVAKRAHAEPLTRADNEQDSIPGTHDSSTLAGRVTKREQLPGADEVLDGQGVLTGAGPHAGRVRQFAHVEGDFAALVSVPVQLTPGLREHIAKVVAALGPLSASGCEAVHPAQLHISLSRTFTLRRAQLAPFVDALSRALRARRALQLRVGPVKVLANETQSCFFGTVALAPASPADAGEARALLNAVDGVLGHFQKPPFYQPAILHFSVAWSLSRFDGLDDASAIRSAGCAVAVDCVQCKLGSRVETILLRR
ncbi:hypothetical protein T492DRAFT_1148674 [Pavlovales sp. CCMP2436]|nr:hypothetical protein T492DRAFT_1148674 [Pavlovales sp. CCMP2436]